MGRASREQAELNRERIIETACELFRLHGVENVSIADVMTAAGLTPGGFYKQFESKEALVEEAFSLAFKQSTDSWARTLNPRLGKGKRGPRALAGKYFSQRSTKKVCPLLSFSSQVSQLPAESKTTKLYESGAEALYREFREGLDTVAASSGAPPKSEDEALLLFSAMVGAGMLSRAIGSSEWVESLQSSVMSALPVDEKGAA